MCPKNLTFDNSAVLKAAVEVVRRGGLEALSARNVARHLEASVAPVYYSFHSMESLKRGVLASVRRLLEEKTGQPFTAIRFLNIGIGVVIFAHDEAHLFRALFLSPGGPESISSDFFARARDSMKEDTMLGRLPEASLRRLWDSFWLYTTGLATAVSLGRVSDRTDENIIRVLKNAANTLVFAEIAGIADSESPDNAREWSRLLLEKKIILPPGS